MKRLLLVFALIAALVPSEALLAQTEISARGATLRIGGRLHAQFQSSSVEDTEADFFFRRARLIADVSVTDFWSGRVQTDFAGGSASLQDAYVRMNFADNFRVSMGQFKRAFDIFELSSSTELSIIERDGRVAGVSACDGVGRVCSYGRFISSLALGGRDQGVRVETGLGRVSFLGSVTNGSGANSSDENDQKSLSGRLSFQATDDITVAAQFARHDFVNGLDDDYANAWAVDAEYGGFRDGVHVQAAVTGGDNWRILDAEGAPSTFLAWQAIGSYYLPLSTERFTGVEPLFRISSGDPDTDVDDNAGLIFTPGVMLYVQGRNKIGFNVDFWSPETGDSEWSLKVQSFLYF